MTDVNAAISGVKAAVVEPVGLAGRGLVELLDEGGFPLRELILLGGEESVGERVAFRGGYRATAAIDDFDFAGVDLVFFCERPDLAATHAARAVAAGCQVIDLTGHFANDTAVPLVVTDINRATLDGAHPAIWAMPDAELVPLAITINSLRRHAELRLVSAQLLLPAAAIGQGAVNELAAQTVALLNMKPLESSSYPCQIAFNLLPVGSIDDRVRAADSERLTRQLRRLVDLRETAISLTLVATPVFHGTAYTILVEANGPLPVAEVTKWLDEEPALSLTDDGEEGHGTTPVTEAATSDEILVSRVAQVDGSEAAISAWQVADSLRRGLLFNAIRTGEILVKHLV